MTIVSSAWPAAYRSRRLSPFSRGVNGAELQRRVPLATRQSDGGRAPGRTGLANDAGDVAAHDAKQQPRGERRDAVCAPRRRLAISADIGVMHSPRTNDSRPGSPTARLASGSRDAVKSAELVHDDAKIACGDASVTKSGGVAIRRPLYHRWGR